MLRLCFQSMTKGFITLFRLIDGNEFASHLLWDLFGLFAMIWSFRVPDAVRQVLFNPLCPENLNALAFKYHFQELEPFS